MNGFKSETRDSHKKMLKGDCLANSNLNLQ